MSETNTHTEAPQPSAEADAHIDAELFDQFSAIEDKHVFEYFSGSNVARAEQKKALDAGEITNPTLDYPKFDIAALRAKEAQFLDLKKQLLEDDTHPEALKQVYRWSINQRIAENRMVQEGALAAQTDDAADRERHMRRFERYNEFLYGPQNEAVFGFYANEIRSRAENLLESDDQRIVQVAKQVMDLFPDEYASDIDTSAITNVETREEFRRIVLEEYGFDADRMAQFLEIEGDMSPEDLAEFMEAERAAHIPGSDEFEIFVDPESSTNTFNPVRRDIRVSSVKNNEPRTYTREDALKLNLHENRVHLERSARGYSSKLKLLGFGLDRNFKPEEGAAMFNESAVDEEAYLLHGWAGSVTVGIARGLHRERGEARQSARMDFGQTYAELQAIYAVIGLSEGKSFDEVEKTSSNDAWTRTVRTFRGTTCDAAGVVYQKDIGYGEGYLETHAFFAADQERLALLKLGRFSATNERHIQVLVDLEILDEDLARLAEDPAKV